MAMKRTTYNRRRDLRSPVALAEAQNARGGAFIGSTPTLGSYVTSASGFMPQDGRQYPDMQPSADKPGKPNVQPVGASGTAIMAGIVQSEEYNADFYWRDAIGVFEKMRRNDAQVWVAERMVTLPLERAHWSIAPASNKPEDVQIASFVQTALMEGMRYTTSEGLAQIQTWQQILQHILLMMPMGFSVFAKWWDVSAEDGYVRWAQWQPLLARSVWRWWTGPDNKLVGIQQRVWRNYRWEFEDIHASRLVRFTHRQEGDNFDGWSIFRPIYKHWFYLDQLYKIQALTVERSAVLPPIGILAPDDTYDGAADNMLTQLTNMRVSDQMGVVIRAGQDIRFPANHQRGESEAARAIEHHDMKIARAVLAPFINLGSTETGAYNLAQQQVETFLDSLQAVATFIESVINPAIRELIDYNFTGVEVYPKLSCEPLKKADLGALTPVLQYLDPQQGDPQLKDFVRKLVGAPLAPKSMVETTTGTNETAADEHAPETSPEGAGGAAAPGNAAAEGESGTTASEGDYALLLSESVQALERYDVVDRGMVFYNHNHGAGGKFAPGHEAGAGDGEGSGGSGAGHAGKGAGGGGGGGAGSGGNGRMASRARSESAHTAPKGEHAAKAPRAARAGQAAKAAGAAKAPKEGMHETSARLQKAGKLTREAQPGERLQVTHIRHDFDINPSRDLSAHDLLNTYGEHQLGAALARHTPSNIREAAAELGMKPSRNTADTISRITSHVTEGRYSANFAAHGTATAGKSAAGKSAAPKETARSAKAPKAEGATKTDTRPADGKMTYEQYKAVRAEHAVTLAAHQGNSKHNFDARMNVHEQRIRLDRANPRHATRAAREENAARSGASAGKGKGAKSEGAKEAAAHVRQGYKDWASGRAFLAKGGNYRVANTDSKGNRTGGSHAAPWNKAVKAAHSDNSSFHHAAEAYAKAHPSTIKPIKPKAGQAG